MKPKFSIRYVLIGLFVLILSSAAFAMASANTVSGSRLDSVSSPVSANALKPSQCSALNLTTVIVCPATGICNGTSANELILGDGNADTIRGRGGTDCILGGGGDDILNGNNGGDVCIGGPGTDSFSNCETTIQ
jgi:Ca2+-binding RTX toxin-like protein